MTAVQKLKTPREESLEILELLTKEVWTVEQDFTTPFLGNIGTRMTVIRLPNFELFIHSPVQLTEHLRRDLVKLGTPRYLIGCNGNDATYFTQYHEAFPTLKIYGTPSLLKKFGEINFYGTLLPDTSEGTAPTRPWSGQIEQHFVAGAGDFEEVLFFHKLTHTILVTDLFCNLPSGTSWFQKKVRHLYAGENALRIARPTRRALRNSLDRQKAAVWLDACRPHRIVMNHGDIFEGSPEAAAELLAK